MPTHFNPNSLTLGGHLFFGFASNLLHVFYGLKHPITVKGKENIPKKGGLIFVANHLSSLDPPAIGISVGRPVSFLAKEELFERQTFGKVIGLLGAISVDRQRPEPSTFKAVKKVLQSGRPMLTFIEGTRSKHPGCLGPPHTGPAYLARSNQVPILPVGIVGSDQEEGKISIVFGKPFEPGNDLEATTWQIMAELSKLTGFQMPESKQMSTD